MNSNIRFPIENEILFSPDASVLKRVRKLNIIFSIVLIAKLTFISLLFFYIKHFNIYMVISVVIISILLSKYGRKSILKMVNTSPQLRLSKERLIIPYRSFLPFTNKWKNVMVLTNEIIKIQTNLNRKTVFISTSNNKRYQIPFLYASSDLLSFFSEKSNFHSNVIVEDAK